MKRIPGIAVVIAALVAAAVLGGCSAGYSAKPEIHITKAGMQPAELVVKPGTTVTWFNDDKKMHAIGTDQFSGEQINPGGKFSYAITDAGTIQYFDRYHPETSGTIVAK